MTLESQSQRESRARLNDAGREHRSALRTIDHELAEEEARDVAHHSFRSPMTRNDLVLYGAPEVTYVAPSGTATGWGSGWFDPNPLPAATVRVTRSRKGRSSFVVTGRQRHQNTTGRDHYVDPETGIRTTLIVDSETDLVAEADRLLAFGTDDGKVPHGLKLTDRQDLQGSAAQTMSQRIGGRAFRGARSWVIIVADEDRAEHWCDVCDYGAEHCAHTIRIAADLGTVENGGSFTGADERLPWSTRNRIDGHGRRCPLCNAIPGRHHVYEPTTMERTNKRTGATTSVVRCGRLNSKGNPCNGTEQSHAASESQCVGAMVSERDGSRVVELVAYDDDRSGWVGHRRVTHETTTTPRARPTTAAARDAVRRAAEAVAVKRAELTATVLASVGALKVGTAWTHAESGTIVTRIPRRYVVERTDGTTTRHATPAAVVGVLARLS